MWKPEVDFVIPVEGRPERFHNLLCQIATGLYSHNGCRVNVVFCGEMNQAVLDVFPPSERVRYLANAPKSFSGYATLNYAMDHLDLAPWWYQQGDDDCMMPWALEHLMAARDGVQMVIAPTVAVLKVTHEDKTYYKCGFELVQNHVGQNHVLINTEAFRQLEKPYWQETVNATNDFFFIQRMAKQFKYRFIPNVVGVLSMGGL